MAHSLVVIKIPSNDLAYTHHRTKTQQGEAFIDRLEDDARYRNVKKQVRCGSLKPTSRALKNFGVSNDHALQYLRRMTREGLLERVGRGYQLTAPA